MRYISGDLKTFCDSCAIITRNRLNIVLQEADIVENFSLEEIIDYINTPIKRIDRIGVIKAEGVRFEGKTMIGFSGDAHEEIPIRNGLFFERATFEGEFRVENITFEFDNKISSITKASNALDFRNVRFFDKMIFNNVAFSGATQGVEISFEDARITGETRFVNSVFEHAKFCFFQTIFGEAIDQIKNREDIANTILKLSESHIKFKGIEMADDAEIDFSGAHIGKGKIILNSIHGLPATKIDLCPITCIGGEREEYYCPLVRLYVNNCDIVRTLYIGNVNEISFSEVRNYGKIVSAPRWGHYLFEDDKITKKWTGLKTDRDKISRILVSTANYYESKKDKEASGKTTFDDLSDNNNEDTSVEAYSMLKENYAALGQYDNEDCAFLAYMEAKRKIERKKRKKYKIPQRFRTWLWYGLSCGFLNMTGRYGTAPGRIVVSLFFLFVVGWVLFTGIGCGLNGESFCYAVLQGINWAFNCLIMINNNVEYPGLAEKCLQGILKAVNAFLVGYFSIAVVRKTLR